MSVAATLAPAAPSVAQAPIRVMIVDDAVVVRGLVSRWIEEEPGLEVVASLRTGRDAVAQVERTRPDVILLDVEMPELDGISALPLLLEKKRDLVIIMVSTVTRRNAEISLRALALGAADYVPKPETNRGVTTSVEFRRELIEKTRLLGGRRKGLVPHPAARAPLAPVRPAGVASERPGIAAVPPALSIRLRPFSLVMPRVLAIGASTGGPQALNTIVSRIGPVVDRVPVLITQHMPPTFTTILAEHLTRAAERTAREACDGEPVRPGCIYVAPGGRHMRVAAHAAGPVIALDDGPLVNFCRPAVDPLFASVARVYGSAALALILTGMGADGAHGAGAIASHGGSVIAQDEATSVVWGMPGSAAHAGACSAVLPLDQVAPKLLRMFAGDRT